jgi:hypothetical protein
MSVVFALPAFLLYSMEAQSISRNPNARISVEHFTPRSLFSHYTPRSLLKGYRAFYSVLILFFFSVVQAELMLECSSESRGPV